MANPNFISGMNTTNQLVDNTDAIHSGLIKTLNSMVGGNMIVEGCNVTQTLTGTRTRFDVSSGKYLHDGIYKTIGTVLITLASNQVSHATINYDYYLLLVIDSSGSLAIRGDNSLVNALTPKVAALSLGDTAICTIKIGGAEADTSSRLIQYLTVDKAENAVSIARDNGGTYTPTSTLKGGAAGTNWQSVATLPIIINDDGVDTDFIIEGNADTALFVVDALEDAIGIGKTIGVGTGGNKLQVDGVAQASSFNGGGITAEYGTGQTDGSGTLVPNGDGQVVLRRNSASGKARIKFSTAALNAISYPSGDDVDITYDISKNWVFDASQALATKMHVTGILQASDDVIAGGDLQTLSNIIRDAGGSNTIQFDGSNNTTVSSNCTIGGILQANNSATVGTTLVVTDSISCRSITTNGYISLEPIVETQQMITPGLSIYYLNFTYDAALHPAGNFVLLPLAQSVAQHVITLKNVHASAVEIQTQGEVIDDGVFPNPNPLLTAPNIIVLQKNQTIRLQAHDDSSHPLPTGWQIIG